MSVRIKASAEGIEALGQELRRAQQDAYRAVQHKIADIEHRIAADARSRAGWSKKIPPTIRSSARGLRTVVTAGNSSVPIAALYEHGRPWHHPLFGNRKRWYRQPNPSRPYLKPALDANADAAASDIADAAAQAIRDTLT